MMKSSESASAYRQSTAFGATAVGQVVALYDTILRDLHRAMDAVEAKRIEERVNSSNHALLVIGELQSVLDFQRGGEAAQNLNGFYNVTRGMVLQASMGSSREKFQEVIAMFARLRAAWSQVERTVAPADPAERPRVLSKPRAAQSQNITVGSGSPEGRKNQGWSA